MKNVWGMKVAWQQTRQLLLRWVQFNNVMKRLPTDSHKAPSETCKLTICILPDDGIEKKQLITFWEEKKIV